MKAIIFLLFLSQIAYGQKIVCADTLSPKMRNEYIQMGYTVLDSCNNFGCGLLFSTGTKHWITLNPELFDSGYASITPYPHTAYSIRQPKTVHVVDTVLFDFVIIAGSDGILRKERQVTPIKEYDKITGYDIYFTSKNIKYRRLNGELLDVVLLKQANYDYIISGN